MKRNETPTEAIFVSSPDLRCRRRPGPRSPPPPSPASNLPRSASSRAAALPRSSSACATPRRNSSVLLLFFSRRASSHALPRSIRPSPRLLRALRLAHLLRALRPARILPRPASFVPKLQMRGGQPRGDGQPRGGGGQARGGGGQARVIGGGQAKHCSNSQAGGGGTGSPTGPTPTPAAPLWSESPSPQAPTGPWWPGCGGSSSQSSPAYGNQSSPWSGYFNYLQQPQFSPPPPPAQWFGENSHFVGLTNNLNPTSPAPEPYDKGTQTQIVNINIDDDDGVEASKSVKKRYWTHDEEVRLASAWLNISKDPIHGNDKKSDSFWGQITEEFNKNSQPDRIRDTNQLKIHWSQLSRTINEFNDYWASVCKMNKIGYSDDQIMEEAQQMYKKKHSKPFQLVHWWKILRNEPKWCTHAAQSEKEKSKSINIDLSDDEDVPRLMGREAAKNERKGKRKAEQILDGIAKLGDNISKMIDLSQDHKKEREVVTESRLQIARDQKEAKWVEAYNLLLAKDTTNMSEEAKARLVKSLQMIEKKIFGIDED
ncbi:hypothetical protein ACP4OV_031854 [Aristida adscensionis]